MSLKTRRERAYRLFRQKEDAKWQERRRQEHLSTSALNKVITVCHKATDGLKIPIPFTDRHLRIIWEPHT